MNRRTKQAVWDRANRQCEYCHLPAMYSEFHFEIDHVIAVKHRGDDSLDNLCSACFYCNSYKGSNVAGVDPRSGDVVPLFNPRQQNWHRHFRWEGAQLFGRTRAARATIEVLRINEEFALAVRKSLIEEGVLPS